MSVTTWWIGLVGSVLPDLTEQVYGRRPVEGGEGGA